MKAVVIINPVSGRARRTGGGERARAAADVLRAAGLEAEICVTERSGHAYQLAREAVGRGASLVCAWGGDGTINEVGRALAFGPAALAIVPAGAGNGFAREIGIPFAPRDALEHALGAAERRIDAGEIGDRLFFNVAGVGLDAQVAARVTRGAHGLRAYFLAGARELWWYRPVEYTIGAGAASVQKPALAVVFANSRQYGYGAQVAPLARLDDGFLDLVLIESRTYAGNLLRVPSLFTGNLHRTRGVMMTRVESVEIAAESPMLFHVDGEPIRGGKTLAVRVHPGALRLRG